MRQLTYFLAVVFMMCAATGSVADDDEKLQPLSVLGEERIAEITGATFAKFSTSSQRHVCVERTFWPDMYKRLRATDGPTDKLEAEKFLRDGFGDFLQQYSKFNQSDTIEFSADNTFKFLGSPFARCNGPCSVPPCCGRPSRCKPCR